MATISFSDIIIARILLGYREVCSLQLSGLNSASELMNRISTWLKQNGQTSKTLLTVDLRNQSQGWTTRRAIML